MTSDLPTLPAPDVSRLGAVNAHELVLSYLALMKSAVAASGTIARSLGGWGADARRVEVAAARLREAGLVERVAGKRWRLSAAGKREAAKRFGDIDAANWAAFAERHFVARALRLDPLDADAARYVAHARNVYAAALALLFDLADPATMPSLPQMRGALLWRLATARFPDLFGRNVPAGVTGPDDDVTRALYSRFAGLRNNSVDAATPALLRRALDAPNARSAASLRRALVRAAGQGVTGQDTQPMPTAGVSRPADKPTAKPAPSAPAAKDVSDMSDFASNIMSLARHVQTPKRQGGYFSGSQVAIAQLYDQYTAQNGNGLTLDEFKSQLWNAVRKGAKFHLTRLDIPDLMDDDLRQRSATPTRSGDVVHFVVLD